MPKVLTNIPKAILTGQAVDMQGIASVYPTGTVPEFIGMQFTPDPTPTPEPTTWGLCGVGGALTLLLRLRRAQGLQAMTKVPRIKGI